MEGTAIQVGAYCRTNWRCIAVLSSRPVGVGVSETLLNRDSDSPSPIKPPKVLNRFSLGFLEEARTY